MTSCLCTVLLLVLFVVLPLHLLVIHMDKVTDHIVDCIGQCHWLLVIHQAELAQDSIDLMVTTVRKRGVRQCKGRVGCL